MIAAVRARILVDHTHLGRTVTGLERITLDLFAGETLAPLALEAVRGGSTARMIAEQQAGLAARLAADRRAILLCPGFPPSVPVSLLGRRVVPYIHDLFLITRPQDLNWRARAYMAPAFRFAVARLPWFLVNSEATGRELAAHARPGADITLYRPIVRDVFAIASEAEAAAARRRIVPGGRVDLVAIGTVEPRKNLTAAAAIVARLRRAHGFDAVLNLVGRPGWGGEAERLAGMEGVVVHGYQPPERVRELLASAHVFLSTSHDEGLGLPLIEAQYAGLPVVAPDKPVFREVLGSSGLHVDPADPDDAAARIAARLAEPDVFAAAAAAASANIARWNEAAAADREAVVARLLAMTAS
ncbi:MAG TPA: glycosyltransferase [Methylomirabilota bacterium]|nr:glycosyltransferase [Methylomirabilota bacterium]